MFYVYENLDFSWLRTCPKFQKVYTIISKFSEVLAYDVLINHPLRSFSFENSSLFYLPIWEWTSLRVGNCKNTTHKERMNNASYILEHDTFFKKNKKKYFWITSASQATSEDTNVKNEMGDLYNRMYGLRNTLRHTISGQRKVMKKLQSTITKNLIEIPYGTPPPYTRLNKMFFQGSFDVCCTGKVIRCKLALLYKKSYYIDLLSSPRSGSSKPVCGANIPICKENCERYMTHYTYCLIPSGDTAVTARLYTSISYGCIPVIISNIHGAFSKIIDYNKFSIFVDVKKFLKNPFVLDEIIRFRNTSVLLENVKKYQKELLWYYNDTAENFLSEVYKISK